MVKFYEPYPQWFQPYHLKAQDLTRVKVLIPSPLAADKPLD